MTKHLSRLRVTTAPSASSSRNFAGMARRPFWSTECWNSPRNTLTCPLGGTFPHFTPLFPTFIHKRNYSSSHWHWSRRSTGFLVGSFFGCLSRFGGNLMGWRAHFQMVFLPLRTSALQCAASRLASAGLLLQARSLDEEPRMRRKCALQVIFSRRRETPRRSASRAVCCLEWVRHRGTFWMSHGWPTCDWATL